MSLQQPNTKGAVISVATGITVILLFSLYKEIITLDAVIIILSVIWPNALSSWLQTIAPAFVSLISQSTRLAYDYWKKKITYEEMVEKGKIIIREIVQLIMEAWEAKAAKEKSNNNKTTPLPVPTTLTKV